jgi:hypothetical protein
LEGILMKSFQVRVSDDLYNILSKKANKEFNSINGVVNTVLSEHYKNELLEIKNTWYVVVDSDGAPIDNKSFKDKKEAVKERKKVEKELNIECFISEVIPVKEEE